VDMHVANLLAGCNGQRTLRELLCESFWRRWPIGPEPMRKRSSLVV
jgi:hypothetical protein